MYTLKSTLVLGLHCQWCGGTCSAETPKHVFRYHFLFLKIVIEIKSGLMAGLNEGLHQWNTYSADVRYRKSAIQCFVTMLCDSVSGRLTPAHWWLSGGPAEQVEDVGSVRTGQRRMEKGKGWII